MLIEGLFCSNYGTGRFLYGVWNVHTQEEV